MQSLSVPFLITNFCFAVITYIGYMYTDAGELMGGKLRKSVLRVM